MKLIKRTATALLLVFAIATAACNRQAVANRADQLSRHSGTFARIVQGFVDDGSLPQAAELARNAAKFSNDAGSFAAALRAGAANSVELAANLVALIDRLEFDLLNVIPPGWKRTAAMVALAAVEEILRDIANDLIAAADTYRDNPLVSSFVQSVEKSKSAATLRAFAKKPKLRCRDAKTGRFLKMERCKENPDTTVVERVKPKPKK